MKTFGICLAAFIDVPRTYHPVACEKSGLAIPPEVFGGRESVGQKFKVKDRPWEKREYTPEHHEQVQQIVFETDAFERLAKPAFGAVSFVQTKKGKGDDVVLVTGLRNTPEPYVTRFLKGNNVRQDIRPDFARNAGLSRLEMYELCDVIIDRDPEHLAPFVGSGKTLIRLLPSMRDFGRDMPWSPSGRGINDVRGWPGAEAFLAEQQMAA